MPSAVGAPGLDPVAAAGARLMACGGAAGAAAQADALDFTSALYLDMRHPAAALPPWPGLTLGKPAALQEPPGGRGLAGELAALQGCEAALLLPSTLHLYWDLFSMLGREPVALLVDSAAYPIARWGAQQAVAQGAPLRVFRHGDAAAAARLARHWAACGRHPVVLADGYSPGTGGPPPLAAYAEAVQRGGGWLVLDDTQALGLLGRGGGGSVVLHGLAGAPVVVGASLAKAFGAPLAVLSGGAALLARFEAESRTRVHGSPPCAAAVAAGRRALRVNRRCGASLRRLLAQRIAQFRSGMAAAGILCLGGAFPVQMLPLSGVAGGAALQAALQTRGIAALLQRHGGAAGMTFLLRAGHSPGAVACAVAALTQYWKELA